MDSTAIAAKPPDAPRSVFISYARKDKRFALRLTRSLRAKNVTVWIDTVIQGGDDWLEKLTEGLDASKEVILVLSPRAKASKWVKKEVLAGLKRDMHVTPVLYRKCGGWDLIGDVEPIDFTEWYDEGFANLMKSTPPPRTFWRKVLILLNKIYHPLLAVLAAVIAIATSAYFLAPSNTTFTVSGADKSAIVVRVHNDGGRPSTLIGSSFKLHFGSLPIETEALVLQEPERHSLIGGHSDEIIKLKTAGYLTPKKKSEDWYFTRDDVKPLLPDAKLTLTAQVRESDDRIHAMPPEEFPGERIQKIVMEAYPDVPSKPFP